MLQHYLRKKYILILLHLLVLSSEGHRKSKKARDLKILPPKYEIYSNDELPSDVQVTKYLLKENEGRFSYLSSLINGTISVSVIPCTSLIQWSFIYNDDDNKSGNPQENQLTNDFTTKTYISKQGLYYLTIKALDNDTYVHVYISTEFDGPQALRNSNNENLRIYEKEKRKSASIKWNPSLVDPQSTDYCLVISTEKKFNSLCAAQASRYELKPPKFKKFTKMIPMSESQTVIKWEPLNEKKYIEQIDPIIACTGKKTHYTLTNLKEGQIYHYNLFAINKQSNLTYPYGSITTIFKRKIKPVPLKHGYGQANLKRLGEKAVFKYKVERDVKNKLDFFVIPCGGSVDVKIMLKNEIVLSSKRIVSFRKLTIDNPKVGRRYLIKIFTNTREDWKRTTGIEIYASNKALSKIPMITQPKMEEYTSLRKCESVTIGWFPVSSIKPLHYCVEVKESRLKFMEDYRIPNQCGLENRLRKSVDYDAKYCMNIKRSEGDVYTYPIKKLKPGKNYIVQVTVKKPKGKTLSYDLLQISTKKCGKHL